MNRYGVVSWFFLLLILLTSFVTIIATQKTPAAASKNLAPGAGLEPSMDCAQLLVNAQLNIVDFDDGPASAEPWVIIDPIVYHTDDPNTVFGGVGYSLFWKDGDDGTDGNPPDPSPRWDTFAQGFQVPRNLVEFKMSFQRKTVNSNPGDNAYIALWLLDEDWNLHLNNEAEYFVMDWEVGESEGIWTKQSGTWNDSLLMKDMTGKKMAILLYSDTDGGGTAEEVYFDNVLFTACAQASPSGTENFLPSVLKNYSETPGPVCRPPSENPADQWRSDRGLVQTGAACSSTLSYFDRADYYTFKPNRDGSHTLWLSNLPAGTDWRAMIFIDSANPDFAPGSADDGKCRIIQGDNIYNRVICNLTKGTPYFVKVSAGSTPVAGGYNMLITAP